LATKELEDLKTITAKRIDEKNLNGNLIDRIQTFHEMYADLFTNLKSELVKHNIPRELREELYAEINEVYSAINTLAGEVSGLNSLNAKKVISQANIDMNGDLIDKDFDADEAFSLAAPMEASFRFGMGLYKNARSSVIRAAFKIMAQASQAVIQFKAKVGNELKAAELLMNQKGYKSTDLIQKDHNGNPTQFLIREHDWASYYQELNNVKETLIKKFGVEKYSQIDKSELSKESLEFFNKTWKTFIVEHQKKVYDSNGELVGNFPKKMNPEYQRLMKVPEVANYYNLLVAKKREALKKLPPQYRSLVNEYLIPAIRPEFLEQFFTKGKPFLQVVKDLAQESVLKDDLFDTEFGQITELSNKMVPIYFTQKVEDIKSISMDLSRSFTVFAEMAENFRRMNMIAGDMETVKREIGRQEFLKNGKERVSGLSTYNYKIMEQMIDTHVYGIAKIDFEVNIPYISEKFGVKLSASKLMNNLGNFIRTNNLSWNIATVVAGYFKGSVDSYIEDEVGLYTTNESKNWARQEYATNLTKVLGQAASNRVINKMHQLLEKNNIISVDKILSNGQRNKLTRELINKDMFYLPYRTADYAMKGRAMLAIYDNIRLVDGKWLTRKKFLDSRLKNAKDKKQAEKEAKKEWGTYREKSLYNAYTTEGGQLVVKPEYKDIVTEKVELYAHGLVEHFTHLIDGTTSKHDKGAWSRNIAFVLPLLHRGWFFNMIDTRFKKESINPLTEEVEIGNYRTVQALIKEMSVKGKLVSPYLAYQNLDAANKRGIQRTLIDLIFLQIMGVLVTMLNLAADEDEEDFTMQYLAFQMNRLYLEQAAGNPLLNWSEILEIIEKPVVGVSVIKDIVDIGNAFSGTEVTHGMYKGKTKAKRFWTKKTPIKALYEIQYPREKNNFMKKVVNSRTYALFKKDEDNLSMIDRLRLLFTDPSTTTDDFISMEENWENSWDE
jgi:hypothetical protein